MFTSYVSCGQSKPLLITALLSHTVMHVGTRAHGERSGVGILCNLLVLGNKAFGYIEMLSIHKKILNTITSLQFLSFARIESD